MKGFKLSLIHCPIHKVKVKRTHYRFTLFIFTVGILVAHFYKPELEPHIAAATNLLFIVDPTV